MELNLRECFAVNWVKLVILTTSEKYETLDNTNTAFVILFPFYFFLYSHSFWSIHVLTSFVCVWIPSLPQFHELIAHFLPPSSLCMSSLIPYYTPLSHSNLSFPFHFFLYPHSFWSIHVLTSFVCVWIPSLPQLHVLICTLPSPFQSMYVIHHPTFPLKSFVSLLFLSLPPFILVDACANIFCMCLNPLPSSFSWTHCTLPSSFQSMYVIPQIVIIIEGRSIRRWSCEW